MEVRTAREASWLRDYERIADAIAWLDAHQHTQPRMEEVAAGLHLSTGHLQRTFVRFAGVSPHRFLSWLTLGAAKVFLRDRATVLETAAAVGLSSPGRLHDLTVRLEAVTPGELGRHGDGLTVRYGVHATPFGPALIAVTDRGVLQLRFLDRADDARQAVADLHAEWPRADVIDDVDATRVVVDHLKRRWPVGAPPSEREAAETTPLGFALVGVGTNLQLRVWEALLRIPEDRVVTYAEVARAVGNPGAARAVANAVGRNPVGALIPCHRVLRSTGELGGYRWGTARKRALLAREAALAAAT